MPTRQRQTGRLVWIIWLATMALSLAAVALLLSTLWVVVPDSWGFRGASAVFALTCGTVGAVVALRRPDNLNGWLFCAIGVFFAIEALVNEYVIASVLVVPGGLPWTSFLAWTLTWLWAPPLVIALVFLPLFFPTGRLLSPRWRAVVVLGACALAVFSVILAFQPGPIEQATFIDNPLGVSGMNATTYSSVTLGPIWLLLLTAIALSLTSLVIRFRRAGGDARQQIKWFALAAFVAGMAFALYLSIAVLAASPTTTKALEIIVIVALMGIPAAAGMAILRYRLYDIDRIISRTLGYAVVSGVLVATFAVAILAFQAILSPLTRSNTLAVAASTLIVAALFQPLRRQVQALVDRRFHRARYDAERTTAAFSERLRDEVDMATLATDLDSTVRAAMAPSSLHLWLREGSL